jgi:TolA-binding protein
MIVDIRTPCIAATMFAAMFCATGAARSDEPAERYAAAAEHFRNERWDLAGEEFRAVVAAAPDDGLAGKARFYLAESLVRSGRPGEAADAFAAYLKCSGDDATADGAGDDALLEAARFRLGESAYLADRNAEAEKALAEFTVRHSESRLVDRAWFYLGVLAQSRGDAAAALDAFSIVTAAHPDGSFYEHAVAGCAKAWLDLDQPQAAEAALRALDAEAAVSRTAETAWLRHSVLERLDRADEAAAAGERFLAASTRDDARRFDVAVSAARRHAAAGRAQKADEFYTLALRESPGHARADIALYESAWIARDLNRPEEAERRFARLCDNYPHSGVRSDAAYRVAEAAYAREDYEAAAGRLATAAAAADDLLPHVLLLTAQTAVARGKREEAERAVDSIVEKFPNHSVTPFASFWRAEGAFRDEDWETAARRFADLARNVKVAGEPWLETAWLRAAQAQARNREWLDVVKTVEEALTHKPRFEQAYELEFLRGRARAARAEFREARESYAAVIADERAQGVEVAAVAQFMIAETYFHQRDYPAAVREYLRVDVAKKFPQWHGASLLQGGKCREQLNQLAEARALYDRLIAEHPEGPHATEARTRLEVVRRAEADNNTQRQ